MLRKLIEKLNNKHMLSLAGSGVISLLSMLIIAILYRGLSIEAVGVWVFFQTIHMLLDTFRTGFLQVSLVKFYAGSPAQRAQEVLGSVWYLGIFITALLCLFNLGFFLLGKDLWSGSLWYAIKWFGITFVSSLPFSVAFWKLQADQRFDQLFVLRSIQQGSFALFVGVAAYQQWLDLNLLFMGNIGCQILASGFAFAKKWTGIENLKYRTSHAIKEITDFGKYSVGTTISANLLRGTDTFIVEYLLGPAALAIYNLPGRLLELIEIPLRSAVATALPSMAQAYNKGNVAELLYILKKYAGVLFFAFIPLALGTFVLGDFAIGLLGGGKYANTEAGNLFKIFMVLAVFYPIDRFIALALDVIHQPRANFFKVMLMLAANILANFFFITLLGNIYGVAIATIFPLLIGMFFGSYWLKKYLPFQFGSIFTAGWHFSMIFLYRQILKRGKA
ncbi:MAG: lipopolysaccharide biosynthesis protein [Sphingobacteriia bacterium]|nr:MAG: lipopolysaccharide biosynthesis protein [Sphingobacteriia bacterium]